MRLPGTEEITRYIFDDDDYSRPNSKDRSEIRIKKSAFSPVENDDGVYETSVMKTTGKTLEDVVRIGKEYVAEARKQPLVALVSFVVQLVEKVKLHVIQDGEGHPDHSAIRGFTGEKEEWKFLLKPLAEDVTKSRTRFHEVDVH